MGDPTCATCHFFELGYDDGGHRSDGECRFRFPPRLEFDATVYPTEGCDLHRRAGDADMAARRNWWPKTISYD